MRRMFFLKIAALGIAFVIFLSGVTFSFAATTQNTAVTVGYSIPVVNGGGGCSGGCGGGTGPVNTDAPPSISGVVTTVSPNSATITWTATDDKGISAVALVYGDTTSYGSTGVVGGSYSSVLSGLTPGTQYFFRITVTDTGNQSTTYTGSLITASLTAVFTISNVRVVTSTTGATISWHTTVPTDSQLVYGRTTAYGSTATSPDLVSDHTLSVINLLPNRIYHFKISSTDGSGNQLDTADAFFTTLTDSIAPPDVQNFQATPENDGIQLSWINPDNALFPDLESIKILRKSGLNHPTTPLDGTVVYNSLGTSFKDQGVVAGVFYSYTAFSYDTSGNISGGAAIEGTKIIAGPKVEICGNGIDDDNNGLTDCADPACSGTNACAVIPTEQCSNGIDDNANGLVDCADPVCTTDPSCIGVTPTHPEVCGNGIDDDNNGLTDCADPACSGFSGCVAKVGTGEGPVAPQGTVGANDKISLNAVKFLVGAKRIRLSSSGGNVVSLAGTQLSVVLPAEMFFKTPQAITLVLNGTESHQFVYNSNERYYFSDIVMPSVGIRGAYIQVQYSETENDVVSFNLTSVAWGDITESGNRVNGVAVELLDSTGAHVPLNEYGQQNPFVTGINGNYGFVVENGTYQIKITGAAYYDRLTSPITVTDNIVRFSTELIRKPPSLLENLDSTKGVVQNVGQVAKNIADRTKVIGKQLAEIIGDARTNEHTQQTVSRVVVPTVVGVSAISFLSFISFSNLLPFLRLLFLQPLLLLGRKKREGWGQVYNALTKLPVDLATLRLVHAETGQVIQTKVTDSKGRYAFVAQPGTYKIEAQKGEMKFPSELLKGFADDGRKTDIYHGEIITVTDKDAVVTANVPLDPLGDAAVPVRLRIQSVSRFLKSTLSVLGLALTALSFYISPRWYVGVLLFVHAAFVLVFRRLAIPPKIKSWGIVYESGTKNPVGRAVARLFNAQFNKLVATQITDAKGRYYFLAGDNKYYVTYEHPLYESFQSSQVDLGGKEAAPIALDVNLKKK